MTEMDSDEDLTKELEPLAYYVHDRKRVLREALRTLKGKRLEAMIPPVLKAWDRPKLECACINVLEDVDDETLLAILDGRAATAGVAAVEQAEPEVAPVKPKLKRIKNKLKKVKSLDDEVAAEPEEPKKKKKRKAAAQALQANLNEVKAAKLKKKKKLLKAKKLKEKLKKKKKAAAAAVSSVDGEPSAAAPHKSLMELLELEYRAKAIKALLKSQGQSVPDIPLDDVDEEEAGQDTIQAEGQVVNGVKDPKETEPVEARKITRKAKSTPTKSQVPLKLKATQDKSKAVREKPIQLPPVAAAAPISPIKSSKPHLIPTNANAKLSSNKNSPQKQQPKKAVIDIIDDALNTSFSEITETAPSQEVLKLEPPSLIVEACAGSKDSGTEQDLRLKLVRKYQQQQQQQEGTTKHENLGTVVSTETKIKKKRKKNRTSEPAADQEDILDLHPQELGLSDDERANTQINEDIESSEADEDETEESDTEEISALKAKEPNKLPMAPEEELIYDDTDEDEEELRYDPNNDGKIIDVDKENSNQSIQENSLWAAVEEGVKADDKEDEAKIMDEEESNETAPPVGRPETSSDNGRAGVLSEPTREDVFEKAVEDTNNKEKTSSTTMAFGSSGGQNLLKRKLTFRIDPARIKALEEQAAQEEAKKQEERKRQEEEERLMRLAEEPEEGEIDSNEERDKIVEGGRKQRRSRKRSPPPQKTDRSPKLLKNQKTNSDCDSDDSQNSTSYYSRRRPYKRKSASPDRDFGKYSPQRSVNALKMGNEEESSKKRPTSPVDFITQFSDMEPISDDSNQSQPQLRKKAGPIQGCSERPTDLSSGDDENETMETSKNENSQQTPSHPINHSGGESDVEENVEEDGDGLPKPVTWYERWAQSHGMSKVVKTNKIQRMVRSKLKKDKAGKKKEPEVPKIPEPSVEAEPIIGSIEEYEKLFGKKVTITKSIQPEDEDDNSNNGGQDDEEEDADDLWGDIIGGS